MVLSPAPMAVVKPASAVAAPESHKSHTHLPLLAAFTRDCSDGRQFIQACELYFTMAPASHFASDTRAVEWALMQMQEGHGANYVECVVQEGITQFTSWEDFWDSFTWEFYKADVEAVRACFVLLRIY
ncbi:hypothetical protein DXG03_004580 [Asterophora parasitica]|uniref:Uncharacterized protein n=1 Tax=Asterophora parasitica TaxID=117018 RepID=A0A9P7K6M3_9AGAR|nr:hypothetical protein DXG03_004580 [Asterophora parasitica]